MRILIFVLVVMYLALSMGSWAPVVLSWFGYAA